MQIAVSATYWHGSGDKEPRELMYADHKRIAAAEERLSASTRTNSRLAMV